MTTLASPLLSVAPVAASRRWTHGALLLMTLAGLAMAAMTYRYYGTFIRGADAQMYYAQVRSLIVDGDLDYDNEITQLSPQRAVFYTKTGELNVPRTADGRIINKYTFGWALITCPPYVVVHLFQRITGGDSSGYSAAYDLGVALWHLLIVLVACAALLRAAARLTDDRSAAVAVAGVFLATNVLYYAAAYPLMAHAASFAMTAFALSLAVHLHEVPASVRAWIAAALFSGLVVLIRPTDAVLLLSLLPAAGKALRHGSSAVKIAPLAVPFAVVAAVVLQLCIWRISYGSWVVNSYGQNNEGFHWLSPALPDILLSFNHGAWYFHPFLMIGFIGLVIAVTSSCESRRAFWMSLLTAVVLHIYVHAAWHDWSFSHSFGHRLFANSAPLIALGAAALLHRLNARPRRYATAAIAILIAWNLLLTLTFLRGNIPPVGEVTPVQLLQAQAKTIGF